MVWRSPLPKKAALNQPTHPMVVLATLGHARSHCRPTFTLLEALNQIPHRIALSGRLKQAGFSPAQIQTAEQAFLCSQIIFSP